MYNISDFYPTMSAIDYMFVYTRLEVLIKIEISWYIPDICPRLRIGKNIIECHRCHVEMKYVTGASVMPLYRLCSSTEIPHHYVTRILHSDTLCWLSVNKVLFYTNKADDKSRQQQAAYLNFFWYGSTLESTTDLQLPKQSLDPQDNRNCVKIFSNRQIQHYVSRFAVKQTTVCCKTITRSTRSYLFRGSNQQADDSRHFLIVTDVISSRQAQWKQPTSQYTYQRVSAFVAGLPCIYTPPSLCKCMLSPHPSVAS